MNPTTQQVTETSHFFSYFLSVFIALAIVLLLAWASLRLLAGRLGAFAVRGRNIKVVETTPLGYKRALHLVQVGGKFLLLGSCDGTVTLLTRLRREDVSLPEPGPPRRPLKFLDFLKGTCRPRST